MRVKKNKKKKIRGIRVYFDNCPMGLQSSEIDKTPLHTLKEHVKIMEKMNNLVD